MFAKRSSVHYHPFSWVFSLRNLFLFLPLLLLAGCGDVEWFPEYERDPTTPDRFSFETKEGVEPSEAVTSDPVTISGIIAGAAPISITGPDGSNSKYSINGGPATEAAGTVSNGAQVRVTHTASSGIGATTTSVLTIGTVSGNFSSTTRTVSLSWQPTTTFGVYGQAIALVTANDKVAGGHVISIKDTLNTSNPAYAVTDASTDPGSFRSTEGTYYTLNNQRIYVRNLRTNKATTILTIDGREFSVELWK